MVVLAIGVGLYLCGVYPQVGLDVLQGVDVLVSTIGVGLIVAGS